MAALYASFGPKSMCVVNPKKTNTLRPANFGEAVATLFLGDYEVYLFVLFFSH